MCIFYDLEIEKVKNKVKRVKVVKNDRSKENTVKNNT